jgi:hypothetical protein
MYKNIIKAGKSCNFFNGNMYSITQLLKPGLMEHWCSFVEVQVHVGYFIKVMESTLLGSFEITEIVRPTLGLGWAMPV